MYKLHKLKEGFIVTSDEEIKEGNTGFDGLHIFKCLKSFIANETTSGKNIPCFYIELGETTAFHETSYIKKIIAQQDQIDFSALSEEDQKRIGWIDVEKLSLQANEFWRYGGDYDVFEVGFKAGFQKAQKLLSDRMFTEEQVKDVIIDGILLYNGGKITAREAANEITESLSQPKSWDVEIEMKYPTNCCVTKEGKTIKNKGCMERNHCERIKILKIL